MTKIKKINLLLIISIFTLCSAVTAQSLGGLKKVVKTKKVEKKDVTQNSVSEGLWYVNLGKKYDRYSKSKEVQYDIVGPKTVKQMMNMGHKGRLNGEMLLSKSKNPKSFKPAMQYPELNDVIMKTNGLPSIPKFYFSTKPIDPSNPSANAKNSFASNERIYGLVKYDRPLKDFLGADVSSLPDKPYLLFQYKITPHMVLTSSTPTSNPMFIKKTDLENDYLAFDVMPDPSKASREFRLYSLQGYLANTIQYSKDDLTTLGAIETVKITITGWNKTIAHQISIDLNSYDNNQLIEDAKLAKANAKGK